MQVLDVLDNPAWHALSGLQRELGHGNHLARRFDPQISPFAALADPDDPACWDALAELAGGQPVGLVRIAAQAPPPGWHTEWRIAVAQMVCTRASYVPPASGPASAAISADRAGLAMRALTLDDGAAMVALARVAQPGPMELRTVSMGRYIGLFDDRQELAAMAGERLRFDDMVEVSGVATAPAHRGRGHAQRLVALVTERVLEGGGSAFLHVRDDNIGAIDIYKKLGYSVRTTFDASVIKTS